MTNMDRQQFVFLFFFVIQTTLISTENLSPAEVLNQCLISRLSKCYSLFEEEASYSRAKEICHSYGGKLASIPDEPTQQFINWNFVTKTNTERCSSYRQNRICRVWFDLFTTSRYSREFYTSDGKLANYFNWGSDQPDLNSPRGQSADLSYIGAFRTSDGLWYDDHYLHELNFFLCETEGTPCNVKDIQIPNAFFDSCHEDKLVPMNTILSIQCNYGYAIQGNESIVCDRNGTWTTSPLCQKMCPPPILSSHSSILKSNTNEDYKVGSSHVVLCDPGYVSETDKSRSHFGITCTQNGNWKDLSKCVPINKFQVISKGVSSDAEIELDCHISDTLSDIKNWRWQKNSMPIDVENGYVINSNGTLKITKFHSIHEGVYTCFGFPPPISVGLISYHLKLQPACSNISYSTIQAHAKEGDSIIMNCPQTEESDKSLTWFKSGKPILQSERVFVVPDGSLVISIVTYTDMGQYSCNVSWNSGLCMSQRSTQLGVEASVERMCGNPAMMSTSPWTVSLYLESEKTPFCYGALINDKWVVTSAYCMSSFHRKKSIKIFVLFGKELLDAENLPTNGNQFSSTSTNIRYVESIKLHPHYSPRLFANDVALIKLKEPVTFSDDIQPICLTDKDLTVTAPCNTDSSIHGLVSGWGHFDVDNAKDVKFKIENMSLVIPELCRLTATSPNVTYTTSIFCGIHNASYAPVYAANFGSPLAVEYDSKVYLLGTFILGERHSRLGNNDYFTKIPNHVSWIKTMTV